MDKKRIFINIHYLEQGGAETALIGLLHALDAASVEVDLFLNDHRGVLLQYVPEWVTVLPPVGPYQYIERPLKETLKAGYFRLAAMRMWAKLKFARYRKKKKLIDENALFSYVAQCVNPTLPSLKFLGCYDLAISFLAPHNIVLDKVDALKKVAWIHTDYCNVDVDRAIEERVWSGYDNIVSISQAVGSRFLQVFPTLADRIVEIKNILPRVIINKLAMQTEPDGMTVPPGWIKILTIGRYCRAKRMDLIPMICSRLLERGIKVKWYLIGYGSDEAKIKAEIQRCGMEEYVVMLGRKENPYPYLRTCDWYVQPSLFEGHSITVEEAKLLGKPVIVTAYPTSSSQISNKIDGIIVSLEPEKAIEEIVAVFGDKSIESEIKQNLKKLNADSVNEIYKLYRLMQ